VCVAAVVAGVAWVGLWCLTDYPKGVVGACIDQGLGHYEVKTYGYPAPWRGEHARLLKQRYGVELNAVAGCCVTEELTQYVSGYNATSGGLLLLRHGHDIFAECAELAEQ
jgi:hypothetical protein